MRASRRGILLTDALDGDGLGRRGRRRSSSGSGCGRKSGNGSEGVVVLQRERAVSESIRDAAGCCFDRGRESKTRSARKTASRGGFLREEKGRRGGGGGWVRIKKSQTHLAETVHLTVVSTSRRSFVSLKLKKK
jgi:hypothetical protein